MEKYSELSDEIKEEVYQNKKETTKFMNSVKTLFFISLINKEVNFNKKIDKIYKTYTDKTNKQMNRGYKKVANTVKSDKVDKIYYEDKKALKKGLNEFLEKIQIDSKSTKTENDKYIRVIKDYYKKTEKTLSKEYIKEKEYLSKKVSSFDKMEKTVRYQKKDGSTYAYFDIASYDSMVYTTNLNRVGMQETIKELEFRGEDIVYVAPHPFACPLCQQLQGKFYSITGSVSFYKGYRVGLLDDAISNGLLHPNCTHIPRPILDDDEESDKYSGGQWEEKYNAKQKRNGLELKKDRLKSDLKIYEKLDNQEMMDKTKQKINALNKQIRDQTNAMQGIKSNIYDTYKIKQQNAIKLQKETIKEKERKEKKLKQILQKQSSATHKEMQELFKIRENRPKYIEQLERKQQELKETRKIINQKNKDMKYWKAKQKELSLKVDIKNLKELINK